MSVISKIAIIQSKVSGVKKDSQGYNYNYESLNSIIKMLHPHLVEQDLALFHNVVMKEGEYALITTVAYEEDQLPFTCPLPLWEKSLSGKANPMQAMGSAITYARRYNIKNIFNLFSTDDDGEVLTVVETISEGNIKEMETLLETLQKQDTFDEDKFYEWLGVKSIKDLDDKQAQVAISALKAKLKKAANVS